MTIYESQIEKMKNLMSYGLVNENKPSINKTVVEYHVEGADGKTYGIIRENHKFYIKTAPKKDTEVLAEDYDYIGGFMNRAANEFNSYALASKQLEMKLMSLNEAYSSRKPIAEQFKPVEKAEWVIEETKEMQNEIDRQRQIMRNAAGILNEDAKIPMNREVPEAPATNPSDKTKNGPFTEKATAKGDKDSVRPSNNHVAAGKPFDKSETVSDSDMESDKNPKGGADTNSPHTEAAKYVPAGSVANQKPKGAKAVKMNEGHKVKVTEEQVLTWNKNKDYLDKAKGTEIGSSAPFCDELGQESNQTEADTEKIQESDGAMHTEGDNINKPKPGNGEIGSSEPFDKKVNEGDDNDDEDLNEDIHMNEDMPFPGVDYTQDDLSEDDVENFAGMPDEYQDYGTQFDHAWEAFIQQNPQFAKVQKPQLPSDNAFDSEYSNAQNLPWESKQKKGKIVKEESETVLDDFGKHPAYQKTVMTLPHNKEVAPNGAKDWNDKSVDGDKPYGLKIGSSAPFDDIVKVITDSVMKKLSQMKLTASNNSEKGNTDGQGEKKKVSENISEKKVLKIKTDKKEEVPQGGMMNNQMPPMDNPQPQMDNQMPPMNDMGGEQDNDEQFDADFDAGVEADENSDPKRYIQQLAGKLSQSLRKYNEGLPNPDVGLNKYVAGMANDAAVEGLSPEDVEEIINKIKSDENSDSENQETPQDNVDMSPVDNNQDMSQNPEIPPMENKKSTKKLTENLESYIDEIVNDIISQKPNNVNNDKIKVNKSFKTKPYTSPMFK